VPRPCEDTPPGSQPGGFVLLANQSPYRLDLTFGQLSRLLSLYSDKTGDMIAALERIMIDVQLGTLTILISDDETDVALLPFACH
jgi:hypothetical protein